MITIIDPYIFPRRYGIITIGEMWNINWYYYEIG